jgi:hypothetical protein
LFGFLRPILADFFLLEIIVAQADVDFDVGEIGRAGFGFGFVEGFDSAGEIGFLTRPRRRSF